MGYVGAPLARFERELFGLICAITREPLANPKLAEAVLQIFAERAAAEMERQQYEETLAHTEERWRGFVSHGNEAIVRLESGASDFARHAGG